MPLRAVMKIQTQQSLFLLEPAGHGAQIPWSQFSRLSLCDEAHFNPTSFSNPASSKIGTPNFFPFSFFPPGPTPTQTVSLFLPPQPTILPAMLLHNTPCLFPRPVREPAGKHKRFPAQLVALNLCFLRCRSNASFLQLL